VTPPRRTRPPGLRARLLKGAQRAGRLLLKLRPILSEDLGVGLGPGGEHYRAFVGPPEDYDLIGALTVELLLAAGLRESHRLADLGCGSLRAGRLLIPYLRRGNYFGVEPNAWLVEEGLQRELGGQGIVRSKQPTFGEFEDFDLSRFGVRFDFVMAQSILSHTYADLTAQLLRNVRRALAPEGVFLATFLDGEEEEGQGWLYPWCTRYRWERVRALAEEAGLVAVLLDWAHPRQLWFAAALPERRQELLALAARLRRTPTAPAEGYARELSEDEIHAKAHREFVGGLWEELGLKQIEFLQARGLKRTDSVLDVGCGALRGGIHLTRFLDPGNYTGVDRNASLIAAGYRELDEAGLADRNARLIVETDFKLSGLGPFDWVLAQSLFTHLPINRIQRCLHEVARVLKPEGRFYATYFPSDAHTPIDPAQREHGIVTHLDADPYHYPPALFDYLVSDLGLQVRNLGDWGHPRGQHMLEFTRR
jgi:SAM-dependent methyltransferase